jgi:hypothetical protein
MGNALGKADLAAPGTQTHVAVLDFGAMYQSGSTWYMTVWQGADITIAQARTMAEQFGKGYQAGTGSDLTSTVYVASGTNNSGGTVNAAAGAALAAAAAQGWTNLQNGGYRRAYVIGNSDFESWGYGSAMSTAAINWMNGYNSYAGRVWFVNSGGADGCPASGITATSCNVVLNAEAIWTVSWSGYAWPLPEIYATSGSHADQWKALSLYSFARHGGTLSFSKGLMTQAGACSQVGGCSGTNSSPSAGWTQLYNALNSNSSTAQTPGAPTDTRWK